jgi:hypothetical protein
VQEISDGVVLNGQVPLVHLGDERQLVHVLDDRPVRGVRDTSVLPETDAIDLIEPVPTCNLPDGIVKLISCHEVDRRGGLKGLLRQDRSVRPYKADERAWALLLEPLRHLHIVAEGGGAGMDDDQVIIPALSDHVLDAKPIRWRIDQLAPFHHGRRLRQPGRIPERSDLTPSLVSGPGPTIKP